MGKCGTSTKVSTIKINTNKNTTTKNEETVFDPKETPTYQGHEIFKHIFILQYSECEKEREKRKEKRCKRTALRRWISRKSQSSYL